MTAQDIYDLLDKAGVEYEVVEIFEGARWLRIEVGETEEGETRWRNKPVFLLLMTNRKSSVRAREM